MQTKDHLALGHFLLRTTADIGLHRNAGPILLGCMEPDYNLATYLRGLKDHRAFHGHHAENSFSHIAACIRSVEKRGLCSRWDCFRLGAMLHYVADAFTWPHNTFWTGGLVQHAAYERELHKAFLRELRCGAKSDSFACAGHLPLLEYFCIADSSIIKLFGKGASPQMRRLKKEERRNKAKLCPGVLPPACKKFFADCFTEAFAAPAFPLPEEKAE